MHDFVELISRIEKDDGNSRKIEKKGEKGSRKIKNGKGGYVKNRSNRKRGNGKSKKVKRKK